MQTFIVKLGCLFLFSFIFFSAYQTNTEANALSSTEQSQKATPVLISSTKSVLETKATKQVVVNSLKFN